MTDQIAPVDLLKVFHKLKPASKEVIVDKLLSKSDTKHTNGARQFGRATVEAIAMSLAVGDRDQTHTLMANAGRHPVEARVILAGLKRDDKRRAMAERLKAKLQAKQGN